MSNTATRLITLIMLLQRQPNQKAAGLADELGVSIRTLHRYFEMLDEMGIPIYAERGPYGGFSLVRGYRMAPLVLSAEEAVAVALGTGMVDELWGQLYREAACGALAKLENLLPDEQRREVAWARRSLIATGMHHGDLAALAPMLEKLRRAVREHRRVELTYRGSNSPHPSRREVDIYALVHRWGWWYAIGYCRLRQAMRTFRVDRMEAASLTEQVFQVPIDFDIQSYLATEFKAQPNIQVRMQFAPQGAHIAKHSQAAWEALEEYPDGSVVVTLTTPDLYWAASSALAYGPWVTVLEPEALRCIVAEWAQAIAGQYTDENN
ncbi:MAG: YafY family transcriptional regulator [Anaerolineae bacterium]|nr:YafY family transcriptional regulator [Anaerolineae bacterium]